MDTICRKRPPSWAGAPNLGTGDHCPSTLQGITALPRELVEKILTNLSGRDLLVCRLVTRAWKRVVDTTPMLSQAFYRRLHPRAPVPESHAGVNSHYSPHHWPAIRHWLNGFSEQGGNVVLGFDELVQGKAQLFPERLFFSLARLLANAPVLACRQIGAIKHAAQISGASFSPDGQHIVTVSVDCTAKIHGRIDGRWQELDTLPLLPSRTLVRAHNVCFSPTGEYCVISYLNHAIQFWEVREPLTGPWRSPLILPDIQLAHGPIFSADGNYLVTRPGLNTTEIHQRVDGQWQRQATLLERHPVQAACFHPQDTILATAHDYTNVHIWQLVDNKWKTQLILQHPRGDNVHHIGFSPDGNRLLVHTQESVSATRCITHTYIYSRASGAWRTEVTIPFTMMVEQTRFSPNGDKLIAILSAGDAVAIWQFSDNKWQEVILPQAETFTNARFSPDGDHLVTTTKHNTAIVWRVVGGQWQEQATLDLGIGSANKVTDAYFSPYGHYLVTTFDNEVAKIWGIVNGTWQEKSFPSFGRRGLYKFSPDGLYFCADSWEDHTMGIWTFQQG